MSDAKQATTATTKPTKNEPPKEEELVRSHLFLILCSLKRTNFWKTRSIPSLKN